LQSINIKLAYCSTANKKLLFENAASFWEVI
jgi:hypothetical protein